MSLTFVRQLNLMLWSRQVVVVDVPSWSFLFLVWCTDGIVRSFARRDARYWKENGNYLQHVRMTDHSSFDQEKSDWEDRDNHWNVVCEGSSVREWWYFHFLWLRTSMECTDWWRYCHSWTKWTFPKETIETVLKIHRCRHLRAVHQRTLANCHLPGKYPKLAFIITGDLWKSKLTLRMVSSRR